VPLDEGVKVISKPALAPGATTVSDHETVKSAFEVKMLLTTKSALPLL
jgi:hypothetical protein